MKSFMQWAWIGCVVVCIAAAAPPPGQAEADPDGSVFQLLTMDASGGDYTSVSMGTAFFINPDGTALTNSHVVSRASREPRRYQLLALIGKEFYSATIVCASTLPRDPMGMGRPRLARDVALVKVTPSKFPFTRLSYRGDQGDNEIAATAHLRTLPRFPALTLGDDPTPGDHIRVIGFGDETAFTIRASRWIAEGTVGEEETASDGTSVFRIQFRNRPGPGGSGSPVLSDDNRVVGMYTWSEVRSSAYSAMIAGSAVATPCP
jgi:V8-like Glu-specific endopeptidase